MLVIFNLLFLPIVKAHANDRELKSRHECVLPIVIIIIVILIAIEFFVDDEIIYGLKSLCHLHFHFQKVAKIASLR